MKIWIFLTLLLVAFVMIVSFVCCGNEDDHESSHGDKSNSKTETTFTVNGVSFKMVDVEGGTFWMGSSNDDYEADSDEQPRHQVMMYSFSIGQTEVTQELWMTVMGSNPSYFKGMKLPVESVSWNDCQTFITILNQLTDQQFRLPTEAEWEYAARGGNQSKEYTYSGSNNILDVGWYNDNCDRKTHSVASKTPNELGIYDMSGNVGEWCYDWYQDKYESNNYSLSEFINPSGPFYGNVRVYRGGNWLNTATHCRVAYRDYGNPTNADNCIGFRLAR
jgi:formylglycine-generating enzyme required for sulfatase activity